MRVADASDVSRVINVARETGAELAVRSGGHSGAGHGTQNYAADVEAGQRAVAPIRAFAAPLADTVRPIR